MKLLITLLLITGLSLTAEAQTSTLSLLESNEVVLKSSAELSKKQDSTSNNNNTSNTAAREKAFHLNYKKSLDLTSIKAYKRSLQIKVKSIKTC